MTSEEDDTNLFFNTNFRRFTLEIMQISQF